MRGGARTAVVIVVAGLWLVGCDPAERYRVLSFVFDGVPPPAAPEAPKEEGPGGPSRRAGVRFGDHGPFAAKYCQGCHESTANNALLLPREQLCFKCHDLKMDKRYVHGPLASGGCTACHNPHGSTFRYLLVSESDDFCLQCHERAAVLAGAAHAGVEEPCTTCHDAHMSDKQYLLK